MISYKFLTLVSEFFTPWFKWLKNKLMENVINVQDASTVLSWHTKLSVAQKAQIFSLVFNLATCIIINTKDNLKKKCLRPFIAGSNATSLNNFHATCLLDNKHMILSIKTNNATLTFDLVVWPSIIMSQDYWLWLSNGDVDHLFDFDVWLCSCNNQFCDHLVPSCGCCYTIIGNCKTNGWWNIEWTTHKTETLWPWPLTSRQ